jgi:subtilisin family serine protease
VRVENESWIGARTNVWAQDWYSVLGMVVAEAAGNGTFAAPASCHGSNTLCVGAYWHTSSMWTGSSATNPTKCSQWTSGCDRELPHVALHGGAATSTTNDRNDPDGLAVSSGTSLATPAAAGLVALMYDRWGGTFFGWPEPVRAAMMASADRDVHRPAHTSSCPTNGKTFSDYGCPDEYDGAGVPNAERLEAMMASNRVKRFHWYRDSSFDAQGKLVAAKVYVPKGKRLRAVLSWSGCPKKSLGGANANGAHADLDLHILNPGGHRVANGASYDGTYEIGEIVSTKSGTYTLEVQKFGWNSCSGLGTGVYAGVAFDVR